MLSRIAQELYWLGRNLARAEFTARAVDAVFSSELQEGRDSAAGQSREVRFDATGLLAIFGPPGRDQCAHSQALFQLTLEPERPESMLASFERARDGARNVRDVISVEMWEAINSTSLGLRSGRHAGWGETAVPQRACRYVRERSALIWGTAERSMLRDQAKSFLDAGVLIEIADMVLRMLRIALPGDQDINADGQALILLRAVGGLHAYLRAVSDPPTAQPVARFLLFERSYPDSVAACVEALHRALSIADDGPASSKPVLRTSRLAAELDFERRALPEESLPSGICDRLQRELVQIDIDATDRYFAGAAAAGLWIS